MRQFQNCHSERSEESEFSESPKAQILHFANNCFAIIGSVQNDNIKTDAFPMKAYRKLNIAIIITALLFLSYSTVQAEPLSAHLKHLTAALSSRNLDSLRALIDPNKVHVEIYPKEGAYLSPSQTLSIIESFFHNSPPVSFSFILVKEEGENGIAAGSLVTSENGRMVNHRVSFGFKKNKSGSWLLNRISIK